MKILVTSLLLCGLLAGVSAAQDDLDWMLVWTIYADEAAGARLPVAPDGEGIPFTEAFAPFGGRVDATVQIIMTDYAYAPIVNFPAEDMWLSSSGGGLVACAGGTTADGPTDAEGAAYWTRPPRAGGDTIGETLHATINGALVPTSIPLTMVSPDLNGDLFVNLSDIALFTQALGGGPDWSRADFDNDQQVNLTDIVIFAQAIGASCP